MSFNNTLQGVANFCSTHADLIPLAGVGGYVNEPFISIVNDALSDIITSPHDYKCNRVEMPMFATATGKQDYLFAGAAAFSLGSTAQGWAIDLASKNAVTVSNSLVTVNTIEPHRFAIGDVVYLQGLVATSGDPTVYNNLYTDDGTKSGWLAGYPILFKSNTSFVFAAILGQQNTDILGAPGINNFGYLTDGSMTQIVDTSSPPNVRDLYTFREQPVSSMVGNPTKVAVMSDDNAGTLKIRLFLVPSNNCWSVKLVYQAQAPVKTSLADKWLPFPDHYSALYRQAVLYRCYRYLNHPAADKEYAKLEGEIQKAQGFDDTEQTSVNVVPEDSLMDNTIFGWGSY